MSVRTSERLNVTTSEPMSVRASAGRATLGRGVLLRDRPQACSSLWAYTAGWVLQAQSATPGKAPVCWRTRDGARSGGNPSPEPQSRPRRVSVRLTGVGRSPTLRRQRPGIIVVLEGQPLADPLGRSPTIRLQRLRFISASEGQPLADQVGRSPTLRWQRLWVISASEGQPVADHGRAEPDPPAHAPQDHFSPRRVSLWLTQGRAEPDPPGPFPSPSGRVVDPALAHGIHQR